MEEKESICKNLTYYGDPSKERLQSFQKFRAGHRKESIPG